MSKLIAADCMNKARSFSRQRADRCGPLQSQKAENLARDRRTLLTIDHDVSEPMEITAIFDGGPGAAVTDPIEVAKAMEPASDEISRIRGVPDTAAGENRGLPCAPNVGVPSLIIRKGLDTPILDGLANRAMRNAQTGSLCRRAGMLRSAYSSIADASPITTLESV